MNKSKSIFVILVGMISLGLASIFVRLCNAPPVVIAMYRMTISAILVAPVFFVTKRNKIKYSEIKKDIIPFIFLGSLLAVHFILWITSLSYTTVLSSTVLVTTNPIFVAIFSLILFKERTKKGTVIGIIAAFIGSVFIALSARNEGVGSNFGNFLALSGAVAVSFYLIFGKRLRERFDLITYIFFVYSFAAIILILASIITRQNFFNYSYKTYVYFFLLALIPQVTGHTAYNWALKYFSASFIAVAILGEPIFATFFAFVILKEVPTLIELVGGALILTGIYFSGRVEI